MSGVMTLSGGSLVIADIAKLATVAGFDDNYLHRRLVVTSALTDPG
jgi:hypothetical protein